MKRALIAATAAVFALAVVTLAGERRQPVRPPTPAKDLTFEQMMAIPVPANERYYVVVFGSQSTPKLARFTHTWATVVRLIWNDPQADPTFVTDTISWMPKTLRIRTLSRKVEPGVNLGMHESIQIMRSNGERVSMWGPYEMRPHSYYRFLIQKQFMESGAVGYQCIDKWGEAGKQGTGCDCIHAITDMDPDFDRARYPLRLNGEDASRNIVEQIARRGVLINGATEQAWVRSRLGLDCPAIVRRCYNGPVNDLIPPDRLPYLSPAAAEPAR